MPGPKKGSIYRKKVPPSDAKAMKDAGEVQDKSLAYPD